MALERASWGLSSQQHLRELILMGRRALPGFRAGVVTGAHSFAVRAAPAPFPGDDSQSFGHSWQDGLRWHGASRREVVAGDSSGHELSAFFAIQVDLAYE